MHPFVHAGIGVLALRGVRSVAQRDGACQPFCLNHDLLVYEVGAKRHFRIFGMKTISQK
jgi:hypothetical protein